MKKNKILPKKSKDAKDNVSIRIMLVDDHPLVRQGLKLALKLHSDSAMEVIGDYERCKDALEVVEKLDPDILILDISLPEMSGIEALTQFLKIKPDLKVIALTMHDSKDIILDMVTRGAKGYILKDTPMEELINAIKSVMGGDLYFPKKISKVLNEEYARSLKSHKYDYIPNRLSDRELEVLKCIVTGLSNKEIADKLFLSIRTIETHRYNIKKKLNINSIAGLTKYAIDEGILK